MEFDWDAEKSVSNLAKHGLEFDIVFELDWVEAIIKPVPGFSEPRWKSMHLHEGRRIAVVFTRRGGVLRVISVRKAHEKEMAEWRK